MEPASFSTKPGPTTLVTAAAEVGSSVPSLTVASTGCVVSTAEFLSVQSTVQTSATLIPHHRSSRRNSINSHFVASIPERSENEEEEERIEAELDEMARYIGPVAKSLFTPVVAPLVDANSFADALGVSPLYKQKE